MFKNLSTLLLGTILAGAVLFSACTKEEEISNEYPSPGTPSPYGKMRFFFQGNKSDQLDFVIGGRLICDNLPAVDYVSPFISTPLGNLSSILRSATTDSVLFNNNIQVDQNVNYSFVLGPTLNPDVDTTFIITDDLSAPESGNSHIRLLHLAPDVPPVNISMWRSALRLDTVRSNPIDSVNTGLLFQINQDVRLRSVVVKADKDTTISHSMEIAIYDSTGTTQFFNSGQVSVSPDSIQKVAVDVVLAPGVYRMVAKNITGKFLAQKKDKAEFPISFFASANYGSVLGTVRNGVNHVKDTIFPYFYSWDIVVEENIIENAGYATASFYKPFLADIFNLTITVPGTSTNIELLNQVFVSDKIYTLVARGYNNNSNYPLSFKLITDK